MDSIKKLDINIVLPPDIPQSSAMEWANECYERSFRNAIERAVSSFDDSVEVVIPDIGIDLGKIEEDDIPFLLENRLKDEIDRHIKTKSTTRKEAGQAKKETAPDQSAGWETSLPDDEPAEVSENVVREDIARSLEEELFLAYLKYINDGYSDLEVLGKQYSFQEIATMIEAILVSSDFPDKKERASERLMLALEEHFPLSFFRMEHTLPLSVISRLVLNSSEPALQEVTHMVEAMIEDRINPDSVSLALFAISSFRARQRAGRRVGRQAGTNHPTESLEELESFIRKLLKKAPEDDGTHVLTATDLEAFVGILPEDSVYSHLFDTLPERPGSSDVMDGLKRITQASVLENKQEERDTEHRLFTEDAGLVLLHPFLRPLFNRLGFLDEKDSFLSLDCQIRAVHLLKCLADGFDEAQEDNDLLLCKLLCGLPYELLIDDEFRINEQEKREIDDFYSAILQYWNPFKSSSYESMRQAFIKRKGSVEMNEKGYVVRVSGSSIDILMDDLPWEISIILLPWTSPFVVEWQKEL